MATNDPRKITNAFWLVFCLFVFTIALLTACQSLDEKCKPQTSLGIIYLGDEFEGGNFIFTETDATTVTAEVRPKCGRLVAFSSGEENPHGVRAVTHGRRCAVALWFTFDVTSKEKERIQADALIRQLFSEADELGQLRDPLVPIRDEL